MEAQAIEVQAIPVASIAPSHTNPRQRTADEKSLADLVESVRRHGILQPVLVRRLDDAPVGMPTFEIVCGHRRHAAAQAAGLETVPALVRELSDVEALEVQVIENLQRENLHPLEEAEGYQRLTQVHGYTVEDLAKKLGKSRAYVYQRMALLRLPKVARELFWTNEMNASLALLIARIPDEKLQAEAAEKITQGRFTGFNTRTGKHETTMLSVREATELVEDEYMLDMRAAPFDILDADLVPAAGPCSTCPKRTGNVPDLFGDLGKGKDLCTDTGCFATKRVAAWQKETIAADQRGAKVMTIEQSAKVLRDTAAGRPFDGDPWVHPDMRATTPGANGRTWKELVAKSPGGAKPREYVARHPKTGKPVSIWKRAEIEAAVAGKAGPKQDNRMTKPAPAHDHALDEAVRKKTEKLEDFAIAQAAMKLAPQALLDLALEALREITWRDDDEVVAAVGAPKGAKITSFKPSQRNAMVFLLAVSEAPNVGLRVLGISYADLSKRARAEVLAERKAAEKPKPVAPAAPAKPKAKAKKAARVKGGKK